MLHVGRRGEPGDRQAVVGRRCSALVGHRCHMALLVAVQDRDRRGERPVHLQPVPPEGGQPHTRPAIDELDALDRVLGNRPVLDDVKLDRHDDGAHRIEEARRFRVHQPDRTAELLEALPLVEPQLLDAVEQQLRLGITLGQRRRKDVAPQAWLSRRQWTIAVQPARLELGDREAGSPLAQQDELPHDAPFPGRNASRML